MCLDRHCIAIGLGASRLCVSVSRSFESHGFEACWESKEAAHDGEGLIGLVWTGNSIGWRYAARIHRSPDVSANSQQNKLRAILDWGRRPRAEQQEQLLFRHWPLQLNDQIRVHVEARRQAVHPILASLQDIAREILTLLTHPCAKLWRRVPMPALGNSFPFAAATVWAGMAVQTPSYSLTEPDRNVAKQPQQRTQSVTCQTRTRATGNGKTFGWQHEAWFESQ